jgi:hypothetical protein
MLTPILYFDREPPHLPIAEFGPQVSWRDFLLLADGWQLRLSLTKIFLPLSQKNFDEALI